MNLKQRVADEPDKIPAGFMTTTQWVEHLGESQSAVSRAIRKGIRKGIVIVKKFKIQTEQRGLYPTPHYKELPDDKNTASKTQPTRNRNLKHPSPTQPQHGKGQSRRQNAGRSAKARRRA